MRANESKDPTLSPKHAVVKIILTTPASSGTIRAICWPQHLHWPSKRRRSSLRTSSDDDTNVVRGNCGRSLFTYFGSFQQKQSSDGSRTWPRLSRLLSFGWENCSPWQPLRMIERRAHQRLLIIVDTVLSCNSQNAPGNYQAELRDISLTTVALGWLRSAYCLQDLEGKAVALEFELPGLGNLKLGGPLRKCASSDVSKANPRTAIVELDSTSQRRAEEILRGLAANQETLARHPADQPQRNRWACGFERAWNMLEAAGRSSLDDYLTKLQKSSIGKQLATNLQRDPNAGGRRVSNFLKCLLAVLQEGPKGPLKTYGEACNLYIQRHSQHDLQRDLEIDPKRFGPSISRLVRRLLVENWVLNPEGSTSPQDLVDDVLDDVPGSFADFLMALNRRKPPPQMGRENAVVWCSPTEDFESLFAAGGSTNDLVSALGMKMSKEGHVEVRYPTSAVQPLVKPCGVHAGTHHTFRFTTELEECGRTIGSKQYRGLREAVHGPKTVYNCLVGGGSLIRR